jgi:hypothetical protein
LTRCSKTQNDLDKTVAAVKAAKTCKTSAALAEACAFGSSADVGIAGAAYEKCEHEVGQHLTPAQKKALEAARHKCTKEYAHQEGTMYLSMNAFCNLSAITRYAK